MCWATFLCVLEMQFKHLASEIYIAGEDRLEGLWSTFCYFSVGMTTHHCHSQYVVQNH